MKKEINPRETSRAVAFELWMSSPMPMVTLTKTFDVSRILKISRKRGWKFNMILYRLHALIGRPIAYSLYYLYVFTLIEQIRDKVVRDI